MSGRPPIPIPVKPGRPRGALFFAWLLCLAHSGPFWALLLSTLTYPFLYTKNVYNRPTVRQASSCKPSQATQCAQDRRRGAQFDPACMLSAALAPGMAWQALGASWEGLACPGRDQSAGRARFAWPGRLVPAKSCEIGRQAPKYIHFGPEARRMG